MSSIILQAFSKAGNDLARLARRSQRQARLVKRRVQRLRQQRQRQAEAQAKSQAKVRVYRYNFITIFIAFGFSALVVAVAILLYCFFYQTPSTSSSVHLLKKFSSHQVAASQPTTALPEYPALMGVMLDSDGNSRAIFDNQMLAVGDRVAGDKILKILTDRVKVSHNGQVVTLVVSTH